mmetsp:Transcript_23486/g.73237  ORF Transcript_23486/g.73237 Transcript_23486/m.73237 type:complete len:97 (+) Transcript_23486:806-1096(+)
MILLMPMLFGLNGTIIVRVSSARCRSWPSIWRTTRMTIPGLECAFLGWTRMSAVVPNKIPMRTLGKWSVLKCLHALGGHKSHIHDVCRVVSFLLKN